MLRAVVLAVAVDVIGKALGRLLREIRVAWHWMNGRAPLDLTVLLIGAATLAALAPKWTWRFRAFIVALAVVTSVCAWARGISGNQGVARATAGL